MPPARQLDLNDLDDAVAQIEQLRAGGYRATGKWNLSQACEHLTATMRLGMDGTMKPLPWVLRATIIKWILRRILRTRRMPSGAGTLKSLQPADATEDSPETIDACIATMHEARDFAGPLPPYPLATGVSLEMWKDLMAVHAAHHLGFLVPLSDESP